MHPVSRTVNLTDLRWRNALFNTLERQIETTQGRSPTYPQRLARYLVVAVLSVALFGGVLLGVWFLEY